MSKFDFSGWATRHNVRCSDGRVIRSGAFSAQDGNTVPVVFNHNHNSMSDVVGHALLEDRNEGVYTYISLNDTPNGKLAKELIRHGDISALSIYANKLKQEASEVIHGTIREVSLVLAGANPGAYIDTIIQHDADHDEEAIIHTGIILCDEEEDEDSIEHAEEEPKEEKENMAKENMPEQNESGATIKSVYESMSEDQKKVCAFLVGKAVEDAKGGNNDDEEDDSEDMKHNVFDTDNAYNDYLAHAEFEANVISDAKRMGSMRDSFLAHAEVEDSTGFGSLGYTRNEDGTTTPGYGVGNLDYMFPDARLVNNEPILIQRNTGWVQKVLKGTHHTPFSRIKSLFADITEDEARAKGYIKGNLKKEEVFGLLKRSTTPTTIYKKQKMDRDDIIDITDFNVVAWIKKEMRVMLDEEIARAILIGDGRLASSDDKINELNIRPIFNDADLFTIKYGVTTAHGADSDVKAKAFIKAAIKSRKNYKGSGNPTLFTTEDMLTDMLLLEDGMGRPLYDTEEKLRTALRVKEIVTVEVMEGLLDANNKAVMGIIVNLEDYNVGADKGGEVNMFDDFDIDYNQQKYLIETRCSGALTKPFSAITLFDNEAGA